MATLAQGGRISESLVDEEISRLRAGWSLDAEVSPDFNLSRLLDPDRLAEIDLFDRKQIAAVAAICAESRSLSEAGRRLFNVSRERRARTNDADRLRKYLARFELSWADIQSAADETA